VRIDDAFGELHLVTDADEWQFLREVRRFHSHSSCLSLSGAAPHINPCQCVLARAKLRVDSCPLV
jgi:hypothetical protein